MKTSLRGHSLPESHTDALTLLALGQQRYKVCIACSKDLTLPTAAYSAAGWRDTQITGMCEPCFDDLVAEGDEA